MMEGTHDMEQSIIPSYQPRPLYTTKSAFSWRTESIIFHMMKVQATSSLMAYGEEQMPPIMPEA